MLSVRLFKGFRCDGGRPSAAGGSASAGSDSHGAGADRAGAHAVRDPAASAVGVESPWEAAGDWLAAEVAVAVRRIRELQAETGQLHEHLTLADVHLARPGGSSTTSNRRTDSSRAPLNGRWR
jgi:hypothetical protein